MTFTKRNIAPFILPLMWLFLWLSINAETYSLSNNSIANTFHYLRIYLPSLGLFFGITAYSAYYGLPKVNVSQVLLFVYIVGLFSSTLLNKQINEQSWLILNMFCALGILIVSQNFVQKLTAETRKSSFNYMFIMTFILFSSLFVIYFGKDLGQAILTGHSLGYSIFDKDNLFAGMANIRATGISRTAVIVFLFCCMAYPTFEFKPLFYTLGAMAIFSLTFYQSRGSFVIFSVLVALFVLNYKNSKPQLIFLFWTTAAGILCFILYQGYFVAMDKLFEYNSWNNFSQSSTFRHTDLLRNTGGRLELWAQSLPLIKDNFIQGYGFQADRRLISSGISLSNGFLYSFLSGGAIGGIFFFIWTAHITVKSLRVYLDIVLNIYKNNYLVYFSSALSLMMIARTLFENSISIFGLDYLLLLTAIFFLDHPSLKNTRTTLGNND